MARVAALTDTEEIPDWFLHRPIARVAVRAILPTPITPNQITLLSAIAGVLAAVALALGVARPALRVVSAALLFASTVLDCMDGQLARARNTMSSNGMALDTTADIVVSVSMVMAMTFVVVEVTGSTRWWTLAPVTLASYAVQCFLFDVVKERYLASHGVHYASSKAVQAKTQTQTAWLFDLYWRVAGPIIGPSSGAAPRPMDHVSVRVWTFLGQGSHMACLYIASALAYFWPAACAGCLLLFSVGMNAVLVVMLFVKGSPVRG